MRCHRCKKDVNRGGELAKSIMVYQQSDGATRTYGWDRPDGLIAACGGTPTGRLLHVYHYKCYCVSVKHDGDGDVTHGTITGRIPTAYEITAMTANLDELAMLGLTEEQARGMTTKALTDRVTQTLKAAMESGTGASDWAFKERHRAEEKGGPYAHRHHVALQDFQLRPHLLYAHGEDPMKSETSRRLRHDEVHAVAAADEIRTARQSDAGYSPRGESDWRTQFVAEVGDL